MLNAALIFKFHPRSKKLTPTISHNPSLPSFKQVYIKVREKKTKIKITATFFTLFEELTAASKGIPRHHAAL